MYEHLNENDVLFYIGAEEGDMAALCAMWGAKVLLFEPNEKVWPNIKAIWEANGLETPLCFSGFASNETSADADTIDMSEWPTSADGPVIGNHGFMELRNANAPQIRIDDVPIIPTALTIDVEGSEWEVLRGAEKTLKKYHPKIWLSLHPEFLFDHYKEYSRDLRNWITQLGYTENFLDYQHEFHLYYE